MPHEQINLPTLSATLAVPEIPESKISSNLRDLATRTRGDVLDLESLAEKLAKDSHYSPAGRRAKLHDEIVKLQQGLARRQDVLKAAAAQLEADEVTLYRVPQNDPGNYVAELRDAETRRWLEGLPPEQRSAALKRPEIAMAAARSPIPGPVAEVGQAMWRAEVERTQSDAVAELSARREAIDSASVPLRMAMNIAQRAETGR